MRALFVGIAVAFLCAFAMADDDLPEFIPCSFSFQLKTVVKNLDGETVATSTDRVIRDNGDMWRWDNDFTGIPGIMDEQKWIIIWRPDLNATFHDYGEKCKKNDGCGGGMCPLPYDWIIQKTGPVNWFRNIGTWEGLPSYIYHSMFYVKEFGTTMTVNVHILQKNEALVLINGTIKSDSGMDLVYDMGVEYYDHKQEFRSAYFIPSAHCSEDPIPAPAAPSAEFEKACYGAESEGANANAVASLALVLLLLIVAMLL